MTGENEYTCPVCKVRIHQRLVYGRYLPLIHDHYIHTIATLLQSIGYDVMIEFPLEISDYVGKYWDMIDISYKENSKEKVEKAWKWKYVDICARKNKKTLLIEVEGSGDNNRVMAVKVDKMNKFGNGAEVIVFSAEKYLNERFAAKNIEEIQKILPTAKDYSDLNPHIYRELFPRNGLYCIYWNEETLMEIRKKGEMPALYKFFEIS